MEPRLKIHSAELLTEEMSM